MAKSFSDEAERGRGVVILDAERNLHKQFPGFAELRDEVHGARVNMLWDVRVVVVMGIFQNADEGGLENQEILQRS